MQYAVLLRRRTGGGPFTGHAVCPALWHAKAFVRVLDDGDLPIVQIPDGLNDPAELEALLAGVMLRANRRMVE